MAAKDACAPQGIHTGRDYGVYRQVRIRSQYGPSKYDLQETVRDYQLEEWSTQ
jgi:hypothetical protein